MPHGPLPNVQRLLESDILNLVEKLAECVANQERETEILASGVVAEASFALRFRGKTHHPHSTKTRQQARRLDCLERVGRESDGDDAIMAFNDFEAAGRQCSTLSYNFTDGK